MSRSREGADEMAGTAATSFPRLHARTQRFTLGAPRNVEVAADGSLVSFLRSSGSEDPVQALWALDVATGSERVVADPTQLLGSSEDADLPPEERARRERAREAAGGIVAYATDRSGAMAVAALAGQLVLADLRRGQAQLIDVPGPVYDPRLSPDGDWVAWVRGRSLWAAPVAEPGRAQEVMGPGEEDGDDVRVGVAEFVAAEEMDRQRGHWWAPDSQSIAVTRVDDSGVERWWITDPASPGTTPTPIAYPAAGTANSDVTLWRCTVGNGARTEIRWDRDALPYLADVQWDEHALHLTLYARDQRRVEVRVADLETGATEILWADTDDAWVELAPGVPARLGDGRLVTTTDRDGARRLLVDDEPVTPTDLTVREVAHVGDDAVMFTASDPDDGTSTGVWRWSGAGIEPVVTDPGVHGATAGGDTVALRTTGLDADGATVTVTAPGTDPYVLASHAATIPLDIRPTLHHLTERRLATALLLPADADADTLLPVLLDPYGGPHAQRVVQAKSAYGTSQWFADQGFAVVVVDGRGTPGRGSEWERAVHLDLAGPVLDDQVDALHALAATEPRLDLSRVAIRGWSFGGYLAALAVLRRPDVFAAAVAGAPVTEWRLYDTHYTERYLGDPRVDPTPYDRCSVLADAGKLDRPLLLVHGLADDNVVAAHTLQLSSALLVAGRPHQVLPLTGVTHMASQEEVAENLLLLQLAFLRNALSMHAPADASA